MQRVAGCTLCRAACQKTLTHNSRWPPPPWLHILKLGCSAPASPVSFTVILLPSKPYSAQAVNSNFCLHWPASKHIALAHQHQSVNGCHRWRMQTLLSPGPPPLATHTSLQLTTVAHTGAAEQRRCSVSLCSHSCYVCLHQHLQSWTVARGTSRTELQRALRLKPVSLIYSYTAA